MKQAHLLQPILFSPSEPVSDQEFGAAVLRAATSSGLLPPRAGFGPPGYGSSRHPFREAHAVPWYAEHRQLTIEEPAPWADAQSLEIRSTPEHVYVSCVLQGAAFERWRSPVTRERCPSRTGFE